MTDKLKEWSTFRNISVALLRGIIMLLLAYALNQYTKLAEEVRAIHTDVAIMQGNRFTNIEGNKHDRRISIVETKMTSMANDIKEIKSDVKILIRQK